VGRPGGWGRLDWGLPCLLLRNGPGLGVLEVVGPRAVLDDEGTLLGVVGLLVLPMVLAHGEGEGEEVVGEGIVWKYVDSGTVAVLPVAVSENLHIGAVVLLVTA
jgi:hypothetical protein